LAAIAATAGAAYGNGRRPLTNGIFLRPGDPHSLYVRTTFGLLVSHDDGCTMNWVCEGNVGYGGNFDPKYAIAIDGTIFATTFAGLRISRDGGCTFTTASSLPPDTWIEALDIGPTGEVWVGTATSGAANDIYSSNDNGATFQSRGMTSPTIWWKSVKVAHSNPSRVYIAGYQVAGVLPDGGQMSPTAHFLRSDDDGAHWTDSAMAGVMFGSLPLVLVAAVDRHNPDVVFMTSVGASAAGNSDILYRSSDGGVTWTEVLSAGGTIADVVLKEPSTVYVATWLQSGQDLIGGPAYVSTDGGQTFAPLGGAPQLACLGVRDDGSLVGCGANWDPDFKAVAVSTDGQTWQKVWRFVEIAGALACPDGTPEHDTCDVQQWPTLKMSFGASGPACGVAADTAVPPKKKSGCCEVGAGPGGLVLTLAVGLRLRRRRRS
jgi:hypothetical protein